MGTGKNTDAPVSQTLTQSTKIFAKKETRETQKATHKTQQNFQQNPRKPSNPNQWGILYGHMNRIPDFILSRTPSSLKLQSKMYVDGPGSDGGVKRSVKDRLGRGGVHYDEKEALKRQRQENYKKTPVVLDRKIEKKTTVRKVVPEAFTTANAQKDLPGSSKKTLIMSKTRVPNAISVNASEVEAMLRRQATSSLTGVSDVRAISMAQPKVGYIASTSDMKVKAAVALGSAKKPMVLSKSPLSPEQTHHKLVQAEELDVGSFLESLGLSKYAITFKAEEVDMFALQHMNDCDLKEIGLPMGPRKKILIGLGSAGVKK